MTAHDIIVKRREGGELSEGEVEFFVGSCVKGDIPSYQLSALLMAIYLNGMTIEETTHLTRAMIQSGEVLSFGRQSVHLVDKHSTGGVGDKVSLVLLPIAMECGLSVPMISGRALGFTGGTLDKLESIPGLRTSLAAKEIVSQVESLGGCFAAQTVELVPADRELYAMRDATGTVESLPLIVSSILSKKVAEGVEGVVIDVKCGRGAFMDELQGARELASMLETVGRELDFKVKTVISSMDQPLGRAVGNSLEVVESIEMLKEGGAASDLEFLTHLLVGEMLVVAGLAGGVEDGIGCSRKALESGRALERFLRIIEAQGGRIDIEAEGFGLPRSELIHVEEAKAQGYVGRIDARMVGEALREMGGGRFRMDQEIDPACGFIFNKKVGDRVETGEPLYEVHASCGEALSSGVEAMRRAVEIAADPPEKAPDGSGVIISA